MSVAIAEAIGVAVTDGVTLGWGVPPGQPFSALLTAFIKLVMVISPTLSGSSAGHGGGRNSWVQIAQQTPRRISSTVTRPSPLQSPTHCWAEHVLEAARIRHRPTPRPRTILLPVAAPCTMKIFTQTEAEMEVEQMTLAKPN